MAQISIIKHKDILEAHRFDAEYFKPEYLDIDKKIKLNKFDYLGNITKTNELHSNGAFATIAKILALTGGREIPYLRSNNISPFFINNHNLSYVSEKTSQNLPKTVTKLNDIIIARAGKIGEASIVLSDFINSNSNQNITNIRVLNSELNPFYLLTFLNTCFFQEQLNRIITGNNQPWISMSAIRKTKIPLFSDTFQTQIEKTVKLAHQQQAQSKQLYKEAEELLLKEVRLLDYTPEHQLTFEANKKEVEEATRFDSEYFQPKYKEIISKIDNYSGGFDFVKNLINWKKGVEVGTSEYTEHGKEFIRVSDFSIFGVKNTNRKISNTLYDNIKEDFQPKKGEILFTKDGTIGLSYVLKEDVEGVLSGAFLRLTLRKQYQDFEKECLALILNSMLCKMQVEKLSGGAIIAHLKPSDFDKFKIPLIKQTVQKQIADKIQKSHKLRKESKDLLEEAKRKVEEEIEKAGE